MVLNFDEAGSHSELLRLLLSFSETEELQEEIMDALNAVYERLDALDADTAEVRARSILSGLGFTHEMQSKKTKDFSGGWRMRVSLARALFIQPVW